ncbi:MAG: hypothetical protein M1819_005356 [Sarea resinae]|nr:MAG: hypothetical protein M1819_005356 [Sarea resinae]
MKSIELTATLAVALGVLSSLAEAKHGSAHLQALERRHQHKRAAAHASQAETAEGIEVRAVHIDERQSQCQFPYNEGLVAVTPGSSNAGWAMSPDQPCKPGNYCPYACPSGQLSAQWDPKATSYTYPQSMNGGLYCDNDGNIQKPFPDKPYCVDGTGSVACNNKASGNVAWCQTVLPGNEAMLIPTNVEDSATLAVPDPSYWASTAAHYYINPPGVSVEEACVWGTSSNPYGNWSPYVGGMNTDESGNTFVKLGWNPIYLEPATPFRNQMPSWGVTIECEGEGCNGLPCAIDPSVHNVNECSGASTDGAGGASFCVVTVPSGGKANFVVFEGGLGSAGNSSSGSSSSSSSSASASPTSYSSSSTSSSSSSSWSSSSVIASTTNSTSSIARPTSYSSATTSNVTIATSFSAPTAYPTAYPTASNSPHVLVENNTSVAYTSPGLAAVSAAASTAQASPAAAESKHTKTGSASSVHGTASFGLALSLFIGALVTMV